MTNVRWNDKTQMFIEIVERGSQLKACWDDRGSMLG